VRTDFSPLSLYYQSEFAEILSSGEAYKGKFNWAAFLFGVFWALSKGLWLSALVAVVVITLTRGWGAFFFWIWYGFRANYIYYCRFAKDKQKII